MPPVQTYAVLAQKCWDAFEKIVEGQMSNYSILGQNFTKHNLSELADLARDFERQATTEESGRSYRSAGDISRT